MNVKEKLSYIKGLMEGMKFDTESDSGKLFAALLDAVTELAGEVEDAQEEISGLREYAEELDEDLGDVEELLLSDGDDEERISFDDDDDGYGEYNDDLDDDDDDLDEDDTAFFETVCPHCGETIYYDASLKGRQILCPNCNRSIADPDGDSAQ